MRDMPKSAVQPYKRWISMSSETFSESELDLFYLFVHVLFTFSKKDRSRFWLEENLKEDCGHKLSDEDIKKYGDIFYYLKGFKNVRKSNMAKLIARDKFEKAMEEARKKYS